MIKDKEYKKAIAVAREYAADLHERGEAAIGGDVLEFMHSIMTPEEIAESNLRVDLIGELIEARREKGLSQKKLEELSGVKQPVIARLEKGTTSPRLSTVLKLLVPLGKTLAIVPLDSKNKAEK